MARVLVIDDERQVRDVLDVNLRAAGHDTLLINTGQGGIDLARTAQPDVVLLDLVLPDMPGAEVCRTLKCEPATRRARVIVVTKKNAESDGVATFELGADDYVTKPFSVRELLLRVHAVRRGRGDVARAETVRFGDLRVDREAHRVWIRDDEVELTPLEFKLLLLFHERRNRVQSRAVLLADVWGVECAEGESRTVDTHVKRLREKLAQCADYIETVRGVGYRFRGSPDADAR